MAEIKDKWPWPANVGVLGTFPEEMKAIQKRVEKNPDASPVPETAPVKFLTPTRSSDNLRMGDPTPLTQISDGKVMPLSHVVFRRILAKARRKGVVLFDEAVDTESLEGAVDEPEARRQQMKTMLARERALLELLDRYNSLAEDVYTRLLSGAKG